MYLKGPLPLFQPSLQHLVLSLPRATRAGFRVADAGQFFCCKRVRLSTAMHRYSFPTFFNACGVADSQTTWKYLLRSIFSLFNSVHIYRRCEVPNCEIRPHYGYDGEAPRFCAQHRAEGMHNLRSRRCQVCVCACILYFPFAGRNKYAHAETLRSRIARVSNSKTPCCGRHANKPVSTPRHFVHS